MAKLILVQLSDSTLRSCLMLSRNTWSFRSLIRSRFRVVLFIGGGSLLLTLTAGGPAHGLDTRDQEDRNEDDHTSPG